MKRLIADEGKILVNEERSSYVVDVFAENADQWEEVDDTTAEEADETEEK